MSLEPRRYLTHDMDQGRVELVVQRGENGDWYVSIVPEGRKIASIVTRLEVGITLSVALTGRLLALTDEINS